MVKNGSECIRTLEEFIGWIKQFTYGEYFFRGVSNEKYKIEASTYRRLKGKNGEFYNKEDDNPEKILKINEEMLEDARRDGHGGDMKDLDLLAKLQHYGAATCLIDFTRNPQVALWMACRESSGGSVNGKVFAVNTNSQNAIQWVDSQSSKSNISEFFRLGKNEKYHLYKWQPNYQNSRMQAQQSIFIFGGTKIKSVHCIIAGDSKQQIRNALEQSACITEASLFPDFVGFASQRAQSKKYPEPSALFYLSRGHVADQGGDKEGAIVFYTKSIQLNPDKITLSVLYKKRASCYGVISKLECAISDYNEVIALNPHSPTTFYNRGNARAELDQYNEAVPDFDEAIHLNQHYASAYYSRGNAKVKLDLYEDAIADFNEAIHLNSNDVSAYYSRGNAKVKLDLYEDAIADFNEAIHLNSNDADSYHNRGVASAELDLYEDAIADFNEAIHLNSNELNSNEVEMSIFRLEDLSALQQVVAKVIIDAVVHNSSPGAYKFTLSDLYNQRECIQAHSNAQDIDAAIRGTLYTLRDDHEQFEDDEVRGGYKLTKGGLLFYLVREKRLQQEIEKIMQALENAKLELNG